MKVLLAAATFASNISGVQRHALNMARCLLAQPEIEQLHVAVAPWQRDMLANTGLPRSLRLIPHVAVMERSAVSRNLWYYRTLPKLAAELDVDVVHISCPMPLNASAFHCPTVVTLHDLYPYEIPMNFGFPKFIFNRVVLRQCLRNADSIACVSGATSTLLRKYAPVSVWRRSIRIYNCVEPEHAGATESPIPSWTGEPFLLCVAQHRRNKNISLLIRAFERLLRAGTIDAKAQLAVIGIRGPESERIRRLISKTGIERTVHLLEGLSEAGLQWCYRNCAVLVAPSITEGFGLPVAEGILAGCRIVCSEIPAHREIGNGFCRFVTLGANAELALANGIADALKEPKPSPVSLPQLSGSVLAKQYVALYRTLIASTAQMGSERTSGAPVNMPVGNAPIEVPDRSFALLGREE